jgi:hypothetical protein
VIALDMRAEVAKLVGRIDVDERMRVRAVQESVNNARACTWTRRAELLEFALSREGDFRGQATDEQIAERDRRLAAQVAACRHRAELLTSGLLDLDEVIPDVR